MQFFQFENSELSYHILLFYVIDKDDSVRNLIRYLKSFQADAAEIEHASLTDELVHNLI